MAAILDFHCRVKTNVGIIIPLCFLYFKTWVCTPKYPFMTNIEKKYMILGYNNRESVAMVAILNKKNSSAVIFEDFSPGCLVGVQVTFLKLSAFYIFPGLTLMLPGNSTTILFQCRCGNLTCNYGHSCGITMRLIGMYQSLVEMHIYYIYIIHITYTHIYISTLLPKLR